jgi:hypothetical protein
MLTNAGLAVLIENINGPTSSNLTDAQLSTELHQKQNAYFKFILWATFGLSFVRFMGVRILYFYSFQNILGLTHFFWRSACSTGFAATFSDGSDVIKSAGDAKRAKVARATFLSFSSVFKTSLAHGYLNNIVILEPSVKLNPDL